MVPTCQWALCCLVRVGATRRFFLADLGGFRSFGVGPPSGWRRCRRVSLMRRRPAFWPFSSTAGNLFLGGFGFSVVCLFFSFLGSQFACVRFNFYGNICWLIARSGLFYLESEH
jgi:hypothetical protein